jgi:hypothetical protein
MGDGQQVKTGGVTLCTDSYKPEEVSLLRKVLQENFGLLTNIHKKKNIKNPDLPYERIYLRKDSFLSIRDSLKEHTHSSMLYKLNIKESDETKSDLSTTSGNTNKLENTSDFSDVGSDLGVD